MTEERMVHPWSARIERMLSLRLIERLGCDPLSLNLGLMLGMTIAREDFEAAGHVLEDFFETQHTANGSKNFYSLVDWVVDGKVPE